MAAVFDINKEVGHSVASAFGILGFPVAAMLLSIALTRLPAWREARPALLVSANLTWISVVLLVVTFALFVATYSASGAPMNGQVPKSLAHGVIPLLGWANSFLVVVYCAWAMITAWQAANRRRLIGADERNRELHDDRAREGIELAYQVFGSGTPLVLLHAGFGSVEMFGVNVGLLAAGHRVIGVDLQSHGRTPVPDRPMRFETIATTSASW